jgi:hypothetical protein
MWLTARESTMAPVIWLTIRWPSREHDVRRPGTVAGPRTGPVAVKTRAVLGLDVVAFAGSVRDQGSEGHLVSLPLFDAAMSGPKLLPT